MSWPVLAAALAVFAFAYALLLSGYLARALAALAGAVAMIVVGTALGFYSPTPRWPPSTPTPCGSSLE